MRRINLYGAALLIVALGVMLITSGCFTSSNASGNTTPEVVRPVPSVESVIATTTGTESAYYATLDIKVKNSGAEGIILVQASITQGGKTSKNEMPVFLKQGETHELKLTFPLTWQGGDFTSDVKTVIP